MKSLIISALLLLSCVIFAAYEKVEFSTNSTGQANVTLWSQFLTHEEVGSNIRVSNNAILNRIIRKKLSRAVHHMGNKPAITQHSLQHLEIDTSRCDRLFVRNGNVIMVNIKEITYSDIIYTKCESEDVTEYYVPKSDVYKVETLSGKTVYSGSSTHTERRIETSREYGEGLEKEGFGPIAMSVAGVGLIAALFVSMISGAALAFIAMILAGISYSRLKKFPGRFKRMNSISIARALLIVTIIGTFVLVVLASTQ